MASTTASSKKFAKKVTEGKSALFLLTGQVTVDKVKDAFAPEERGELVQSNLSAEQEAKLKGRLWRQTSNLISTFWLFHKGSKYP